MRGDVPDTPSSWVQQASGTSAQGPRPPAPVTLETLVCFFQGAQKFNTRYATLGFSDTANLDEGSLWPVAFALKELTATEEARIRALVKKAVS